MSMTAFSGNHMQTTRERSGRRDGLIGIWGRIIHRDPEAYEAWLEERDMSRIVTTLLRLNERQLNRLGLSRATLALDVEELAIRAEQELDLASDIVRLVDGDDGDNLQSEPRRSIAAE